jgi:outer membrane protein assembly factor BamA
LKLINIKIFGIALITLLFLVAMPNRGIASEIDYNELYSSPIGNGMYEVGKIKITGNKYLDNDDIMSILVSRETNRSPLHKIFNFYYEQIQINPYSDIVMPTNLPPSLKKFINKWDDELPFFSYPYVISDSMNLVEYYNQHGYHEVQVDYEFYPDESEKINILEFKIIENTPYTIKAIKYYGLDSVDSDTKGKIRNVQKIRPGRFFSEAAVTNEIRNTLRELLNNGYYYAYYEVPDLTVDLDNKEDSITVKFKTGKRQRIGDISFVDSLNNQTPVTKDMKQKQMEIHKGEWFNRKYLEKSRDNLYNLGTFEVVYIDTTSSFHPQTDTSISLMILTSYRKQEDWGAGFFFNQSTITGNLNAGIDAYYLNRNIGGIAQSFSPYAKIEFQNLNDFSNLTRDIVGQIGIQFAQPLLFTADKARVGLTANPKFSYENIFEDLRSLSWSLPIKFPTQLPEWTYFQYFSFDFLVERQMPIEFGDFYDKAINDTNNTEEDIVRIKKGYRSYKTLNDFDKPFIVPSALIAGFSLIGDKRDHPFLPTSGYFSNFTYDGWVGAGIAKFYRGQFTYYNFQKITGNAVLAIKAKAGGMFWVDRDNSYVPSDKQFFSGGANSVRGWASRRLRYENQNQPIDTSQSMNFLQDYVGSAVMIEGTLELRIRVPRQKKYEPKHQRIY